MVLQVFPALSPSVLLFVLLSASRPVSGQNEMSANQVNDDIVPGQIGYTSLIILLFFLFTVFGLLAAFLIKHKPKRKAQAAGRSAKLDIERQLDTERSSKDPNADDLSEVATFDFLDSYEANKQPVIRFSDPKGLFESDSEQVKDIKEKLLEDYLRQQEASYTSPDSLQTDDLADIRPADGSPDKLLDDDSSVNAQSPQFQEIPKELIIANVEPVQKEEDTQTEPFPTAEVPKRTELDTFSASYTPSVDEEEDQLEDELKLVDDRVIDKKIDDLLDAKLEAKFNGMPGESGEQKNEELKLKNEDIPEYVTFPDGSDSGKSDRESIKSTKSTKSYHSYGFPHEDYPSDPVQPEFKPQDDANSNPASRWRKLYENQKLAKPSDYNELMKSLHSPSTQKSGEDVKELPKKVGGESDKNGLKKSEKLGEQTEEEPKEKFEVIVCPPLETDSNAEKTKDNENPSSPSDTNATSTATSASTATNVSTATSPSEKDVFSSPEDTNPDLLFKSLLNESETSSLQSERLTSSASANEPQQVREAPNDLATDRLKKAKDKLSETASLKTLNSDGDPPNDYAIPKKPSEDRPAVKVAPKAIESKQTKSVSNLSPLSGPTQSKLSETNQSQSKLPQVRSKPSQTNQLQSKQSQGNQLRSNPPQSNQPQRKVSQTNQLQQSKASTGSQPTQPASKRTSKSVLDVLEKRKQMP